MAAEKRGPGRPATGQTKQRIIRAGDIWDEGTAVAKQRGETMTDLVLRALERELKRLKKEA